jgi:hypothetical protein
MSHREGRGRMKGLVARQPTKLTSLGKKYYFTEHDIKISSYSPK